MYFIAKNVCTPLLIVNLMNVLIFQLLLVHQQCCAYVVYTCAFVRQNVSDMYTSDNILSDCKTDLWGSCWCRYFHVMLTSCCQSTTRHRYSNTRQHVRWETGAIQSTFRQAERAVPHRWESDMDS